MRNKDCKIVSGTYGSAYTPCEVFVYKNWYCVEGSRNVNYTLDDIELGVDVEVLNDLDYFYAAKEIDDIDDLVKAVDSHEEG